MFKREEFELGQYRENSHFLEFEDLAINSQENSETVINDEPNYVNRLVYALKQCFCALTKIYFKFFDCVHHDQ